MKHYVAGMFFVALAAVAVVPTQAKAETAVVTSTSNVSGLLEMVQSLMKQVETLQKQLAALKGEIREELKEVMDRLDRIETRLTALDERGDQDVRAALTDIVVLKRQVKQLQATVAVLTK